MRSVDLDSLGEAGTCRSPIYLNPANNPATPWPAGVNSGNLVTAA